jgi:hypothetical protein
MGMENMCNLFKRMGGEEEDEIRRISCEWRGRGVWCVDGLNNGGGCGVGDDLCR